MTAATDTPECVKEVRSGKTRRLEQGRVFFSYRVLQGLRGVIGTQSTQTPLNGQWCEKSGKLKNRPLIGFG